MRKSFIILILTMIPFAVSFAQDQIKQTVKGTVVDVTSKTPIIGATIIIEGINPIKGTITDGDGNFRFSDLSLGRYNFRISSVGYEPKIVNDILVGSAKEVILSIELTESAQKMNEVVIRALSKDQPLNPMAMVSAKTFTVEETRRYAGGLDDPARMVSAFAGVTEANMRDNAIIIRGNSPKGVLWRLEGVKIPNPNHFTGGNVVGGGGVSMLSSQLLTNSDFFTGAFPAEYGNAIAGVFDMKLRNGNTEKYEHAVQLGALGIDLSSEGPLSKKSQASYVFNYRYSTLALIAKIGVMPESEIPKYQDLSFKINIPTKKAGSFSIWGLGGLDQFDDLHENDSTKWETFYDRSENLWRLNTGVIGFTHKQIITPKTFINNTISLSGVQNQINAAMFDFSLEKRPFLKISDNSGNAIFSSFISHKFGSGISVKTGLNFYQLFYNLSISSVINEEPDSYSKIVDENGNSSFSEYYIQAKYMLSPKLTANFGLHSNYFLLNREFSLDPRAGIRWDFLSNHALSFGYGKHSQTEELRIYLAKKYLDGNSTNPNKGLKLSKAHHFILAYEWLVNKNVKLKIEPYYQYLYDIPGIANSSYSLINFKQDWNMRDSLGNNSTGTNLGIDFTLERYFNKNYYFLLTASVFNSKYLADDGVLRNTRYNKRFALNFLSGKEFAFGNTKLLGLNLRLSYTGGERTSPVNYNLSLMEKRVIYSESMAFSKQLPSACFADITITFRNNKEKFAGIWALQVKNVLGAKMYDGYSFNYNENKVVLNKYVVVLPVLSYKVEF